MGHSIQNLPNGVADPLDMYKQLQVLGEGAFGKVTKCRDKQSGEIVAVKQVKSKSAYNVIRNELAMLGAISGLDPDVNNIVKFHKYFYSRAGHHCLEFEILDQSVSDLMSKQLLPLSLQEIRPMAKQLLVALNGLRWIGVMHTDIKPDNIMLVDHEKKPFKIKLIDFGLAVLSSEAKIGLNIQLLVYRAPEVILGLPLSEAVDMWSLGCFLLECYLTVYPINCYSSYDSLKQISHLLGFPDGDLITQAKHGMEFFIQEGSQWRLKTPREYKNTTGMPPELGINVFKSASDLEAGILNYYPKLFGFEMEDRRAFADLVKKMFAVNPEERITPAEALMHPFITMSHMRNANQYITVSAQNMNFMPPLTQASETKSSIFYQRSADEEPSQDLQSKEEDWGTESSISSQFSDINRCADEELANSGAALKRSSPANSTQNEKEGSKKCTKSRVEDSATEKNVFFQPVDIQWTEVKSGAELSRPAMCLGTQMGSLTKSSKLENEESAIYHSMIRRPAFSSAGEGSTHWSGVTSNEMDADTSNGVNPDNRPLAHVEIDEDPVDNMSEVSSLHDSDRSRAAGRAHPPALSTVYDQDEAMSTISSVSQHVHRRPDDRRVRARSMDNLDDIGRHSDRDDYRRRPDVPRGRRGSDDEWSTSARSDYDRGYDRVYDDRRRRDYSPDERRREGGANSGLAGKRSRSRDDLMDLERGRRYEGGARGGRDDYDDSILREAMERKKLSEQQRARSRERLDSESDRSDRGRVRPPPLPSNPPSGNPGRRDDYPPPLPPPYSDNESMSSSKKSNLRKNGAVSRESLVV